MFVCHIRFVRSFCVCVCVLGTYSYRRSAFPMARRRNLILSVVDWIHCDRLVAFSDVSSLGLAVAVTLLSETWPFCDRWENSQNKKGKIGTNTPNSGGENLNNCTKMDVLFINVGPTIESKINTWRQSGTEVKPPWIKPQHTLWTDPQRHSQVVDPLP